MSLPEIIEVSPLAAPVRAQIGLPGSKSITNRALALAALAEGEIVLHGALWSEDTQVMVECLQELGYLVTVTTDPREATNRTVTVYGQGGRVPRGGSPEQPLELFVGNAGTTARFLLAVVCLGQGVYRLDGVPRMRERPQSGLLTALRELGYRIDAPNDKLPALVHGGGPRPGRCHVSIEESSQFASALLLAGRASGWEIEVLGRNPEESPYVAMTQKLIAAFPRSGGDFSIEPDASGGSYFWAAKWLLGEAAQIAIQWSASDWQVDAAFPRYWPMPSSLSRERDLGDSIMTAIVVAPFAAQPVRFADLGRLRLQECERVAALRKELTRCGALVVESGDTLQITPSNLHGATIETYNDHRMAMCFAILGLKVPGMKIKNPACVKKTFPSFFQKLAAPPPHGLGAAVHDARTGERLGENDLLAD